MLSTRLGRIVQFLFACGILMTAMLMLRIHRAQAEVLGPAIDPERATRTYIERMDATERMLESGQLEVSGR